MTPDNDPDFDSNPVATRYAAMDPGQEPEPGKSVNRKMKDAMEGLKSRQSMIVKVGFRQHIEQR